MHQPIQPNNSRESTKHVSDSVLVDSEAEYDEEDATEEDEVDEDGYVVYSAQKVPWN